MPRSIAARAAPRSPDRSRVAEQSLGLAPEDARALYDRLAVVLRAVRAAADEEYARFGIGCAQAKFIRHIGVDSRISQADLARATAAAPTLTGRALESLIERGWVRRRRSAADRREYLLELTAAGQRARAKVIEARTRIIDRIGAALGGKDLADFERVAAKILAALDAPEVPRMSI